MPNRDGTGPEGKGSKTGRGQGKCGSNRSTQSEVKKENRQGMGMGRRRQFNN